MLVNLQIHIQYDIAFVYNAVQYKLQPNVVWQANRILCEQADYRQYRVLVDNKDAQHAESDWLIIHTAQKYSYLHIYPEEKFPILCHSY